MNERERERQSERERERGWGSFPFLTADEIRCRMMPNNILSFNIAVLPLNARVGYIQISGAHVSFALQIRSGSPPIQKDVCLVRDRTTNFTRLSNRRRHQFDNVAGQCPAV